MQLQSDFRESIIKKMTFLATNKQLCLRVEAGRAISMIRTINRAIYYV